MLWTGLENVGLWLARKLVSIWVKVTVIPEEKQLLAFTNGKPIFYILESRSLANLLILERECLRLSLPQPTAELRYHELILSRSVTSLRRSQGVFRLRPGAHSYSQNLAQLLATVKDQQASGNDNAADVLVVPVAVFWGRRPEREDSWFKLLLADSWQKMGQLRKFLVVLLHGRNTWLQFSQPVSLVEFLQEDKQLTAERATRKLARVLRVHFRQLRQAAIGPDLSQRQLLVEQVLRKSSVQQHINANTQIANAKTRMRARARRYGREIAADFSYPFVILMRRILSRLWNRLYDGVVVNHIETVQRIAPGHTVVYLPCHRSHIDYLLLSYVLHERGLAIPHVAAGVNLNIPVIGTFLRRGGAFFLRRSFKGNRLYATVFHTYLSVLLEKGFAVEYFIEGGRSRTGYSLQPKPGMLDMTVRSFLVQPTQPLVFIPVYIGYEKLVEGGSYLAELGGAKKQKESFWQLVKGLRALRSEFGQVYVNFGQPIVLAELLDSQRQQWRQESLTLTERPEWLSAIIKHLGHTAMVRINATAAVNPINLIALIVLAMPLRAIAEEDLLMQLKIYLRLCNKLSYWPQLTVTQLTPDQIITHGLRLGSVLREEHPLGAVIKAEQDQAVLLSYFRNNVLHVLAIAGFIVCCLQNTSTISHTQVLRLSRLVYPLLKRELFLPWSAEKGLTVVSETIALLSELTILSSREGHLSKPVKAAINNHNQLCLTLLAQAVSSTVERFFLTVSLLLASGKGVLTGDDLQQRSYLLAQRLAMLYAYKTPDFSDRNQFNNILDVLQEMKLVQIDEDDRLVFGAEFELFHEDASLMLAAPVRQTITQLTTSIKAVTNH